MFGWPLSQRLAPRLANSTVKTPESARDPVPYVHGLLSRRPQYSGYARSRLSLLAGGFQIAPGFLDDFFQIANAFLHFSFGLLFQPFGLLLFAANELTGLLLDLAANAFRCAFDLILVHDECLDSIDDSHRPKWLDIRQLPA